METDFRQNPGSFEARPLAGKIVIITEASRGIGRAIALRVARDGAKAVLAARDKSALEKVVEEIAAAGGSATAFAADLSQPEAPSF